MRVEVRTLGFRESPFQHIDRRCSEDNVAARQPGLALLNLEVALREMNVFYAKSKHLMRTHPGLDDQQSDIANQRTCVVQISLLFLMRDDPHIARALGEKLHIADRIP